MLTGQGTKPRRTRTWPETRHKSTPGPGRKEDGTREKSAQEHAGTGQGKRTSDLGHQRPFYFLRFLTCEHRHCVSLCSVLGTDAVAILAQVGIQAPGLSFRCICHPGNPIKTRFESGFCLLCTSHALCCLSPYHQVWNDGLYWVLSDIRGGTWVCSWEGASHVQD